MIRYGADVNIQDKEGVTPLMLAAKSGSLPLVKILIEAGVNTSLEDTSHWSALKYAKYTNHMSVYEYLENLVQSSETDETNEKTPVKKSHIPLGLFGLDDFGSQDENETDGKKSLNEESDDDFNTSWSDHSHSVHSPKKEKPNLTKFLPSSNDSDDDSKSVLSKAISSTSLGPPKPPRLNASASSLVSHSNEEIANIESIGENKMNEESEGNLNLDDSWNTSNDEDEDFDKKGRKSLISSNVKSTFNLEENLKTSDVINPTRNLSPKLGSNNSPKKRTGIFSDLDLKNVEYESTSEEISFAESDDILMSDSEFNKSENKVKISKANEDEKLMDKNYASSLLNKEKETKNHSDNARNETFKLHKKEADSWSESSNSSSDKLKTKYKNKLVANVSKNKLKQSFSESNLADEGQKKLEDIAAKSETSIDLSDEVKLLNLKKENGSASTLGGTLGREGTMHQVDELWEANASITTHHEMKDNSQDNSLDIKKHELDIEYNKKEKSEEDSKCSISDDLSCDDNEDFEPKAEKIEKQKDIVNTGKGNDEKLNENRGFVKINSVPLRRLSSTHSDSRRTSISQKPFTLSYRQFSDSIKDDTSPSKTAVSSPIYKRSLSSGIFAGSVEPESTDILSEDDSFMANLASEDSAKGDDIDDGYSAASTETEESIHIDANIGKSITAPLASFGDEYEIDQARDFIRELRIKLEKEINLRTTGELKLRQLKSNYKKLIKQLRNEEANGIMYQQETANLISKLQKLEYDSGSQLDETELNQKVLEEAKKQCSKLQENLQLSQLQIQEKEQVIESLTSELVTKECLYNTLHERIDTFSSSSK